MRAFETQNATDGTVLRGAVHAPESPRAVMTLVHGFGEHQGRYAHMISYFNHQGIAVVTMDLRGHGISDGKRGICNNYDLLLGDLDAQMAETGKRFDGLPHYLYGHSMGGGVVLRYVTDPARADGLAGLIASAPLIVLPDPPPKPVEVIVKFLRKVAPNMTLPNAIDGTKISSLPAEQELYLNDPLCHGKLGVGLAVGLIENGETILERAETIKLPVLLMHAVDDQLTGIDGSRQFSKLATSCDFYEMENCEHEMHNDITRERVYGLMTDFITSGTTA